MDNEISKMYENAGFLKKQCKDYSCTVCEQYNDCEEYPPFTAEKQLELIKWLAKKDCMYRLTYERDFLWCSQLEWQSSFCYESFEESLANLINSLWQDLTNQEKEEIRNILNA